MTNENSKTATENASESDPADKGYSAIKFIVGALLVAGLLVLANAIATGLTIGRPVASAQALCDQVNARVNLINQSETQKLILVGGSGVRAGFSATLLSDALSVNAYNFGLQASFGPDLTLSEARRVLKPGDSVLLAFEYPQYEHDNWSPNELNYAFSCAPEFLKDQSVSKIVEALMAIDITRLFDVVSYALAKPEPIEQFATNRHGDRLAESFPQVTTGVKNRLSLYQPLDIGIDLGSRGVQAIVKFLEFAGANNIAVHATWPNTIDFQEYSKAPGFNEIRQFYASQGVTMIGDPELGLYPLEAFYDTQYHLDYPFIQTRTQDFITQVGQQNIDLTGNPGR